MLSEQRFDGVAQLHRHRNEDAFPTVDKHINPRIFGIGADTDRDIFEQHFFKLVPGAQELNERHRLFAEININGAIRIARTDLDDWRDFFRQQIERTVHKRTQAIMADHRVKHIGIGFFLSALLIAHRVTLRGFGQTCLRDSKWELILAKFSTRQIGCNSKLTHARIIAESVSRSLTEI